MIYHEWQGHGPPVVLLHGVGLDRTMWDRVVSLLKTRYSVCTPDLRGHGYSSTACEDITLSELAADITGLLSQSTHVVGFSLGALIAQQLALDSPDLVRSLVLVSAVCRRSPAERQATFDRLAAARIDRDSAGRSAVARWFSADWLEREPALAARILQILLQNDSSSYLACYNLFANADAELWPKLPKIMVPTLAITGEHDRGSTPDMTRLLARTVPNGRAVVIPETRHLVPLESPRKLVQHLLPHFLGSTLDP